MTKIVFNNFLYNYVLFTSFKLNYVLLVVCLLTSNYVLVLLLSIYSYVGHKCIQDFTNLIFICTKYVAKIYSVLQAKCMAACQSSVDLIRHLSALLRDECESTPEEACTSQVEELVVRYQRLLAQKQATEREQREARWAFWEEMSSLCLALQINQTYSIPR